MKNMHRRLLAFLLFLTLGTLTTTFAQITPSQDSYTNTTASSTNYGTSPTLGLASTSVSIQTVYIQFDLSSIPAGYNSNNIAKATLKLFVDSVTAGGSLNVDYVNGSWSEKTITANLLPPLGGSIAAGVPLTSANANDYLLVDVTPAVGAWLNGSQVNDGIALVANSGLSAVFESKENTNQSHPAELDIVFTSGGTITGVTTASGSGVTGGGTSGTLSLSLQKNCSTNQVLQWNGSSWVCSSTGTGSVSSVGLSAPSSDFAVSGSPVTGTGMLNFVWNVAPTSASTPNAIVKRDASGDFNANIIDVGELVTQSVVASNVVVSSGQNTDAVQMEAWNQASSGSQSWGILGATNSATNGATAIVGHAYATSGLVQGVQGVSNSPSGFGVSGVSVSASVVGAGDGSAGVWGDSATNWGVLGTSDNGVGGLFLNNSAAGYPTLAAFSENGAAYPFLAYNNVTSSSCNIDANANLNCTGAKHAVIPIDGGQRKVALSAIESPVNWFEDAGSARLINGAAVVGLDSDFVQTVNTEMEYNVFLTPYGDCKGLYVSNRTATSFEVHEQGGGAASVPFGYRIMALRKNYENIRMEDHTHDPDPAKLMKAMNKVGSSAKVDMRQPLSPSKLAPNTHPIVQKPLK
jgi:hypothetical protein